MSNTLKQQKKSEKKPASHALLRQPADDEAFKAQAFTASPAARKEALSSAALAWRPAEIGNPALQILGDSGSSEALKILQEHTDHIKRVDTLILLRESLDLFKKGEWAAGGESALKALHVDEKCGEAWHMLGISRDKCDDFNGAITCYETALRLLPENPIIANDLGRLSYKMGLNDIAVKFFRFFLEKCPGHVEAINNLASAYRECNRLDDAIDLLRNAIADNPTHTQLWNALGTIVNAQGDMENAIIFYEEALRHDPNHSHARYNLGNARGTVGDIRGSLEDLKAALPLFQDSMNIHTCKLSIAFAHLALGELEDGWHWYEIRGKEDTSEGVHIAIPRPRWRKDQPLAGKKVFVSAEQGLGDEVLFGSIIPDMIRDIGPDGHLSIGVEPRLVPLFRRSFPDATVVHHHTTKFKGQAIRLFPDVTDWEPFDCWANMADLLGRYRGHIEDFPVNGEAGPYAFLTPDPERVAYWKSILNGLNAKPKIGLLWKSLIKHSRRDRYYSPFDQWEGVLRTEGVQFVNLQYGDTTEEMELARAAGFDIWTPPGIDLKMDLDDLAALCVAMDCIICPANATSNIAGACGATVWMISPGKPWTSLGTDHFPWYPSTRLFLNASLLDWTPVMGDVKAALIETFVAKNG